ncbi:GIY-YIG nuclease family protein [Syntrophomonas palmitatica]|uniref:GIY-YIG nuclease family protein n=1 Tax=Syntrophomonas palmitatica TaxID=402877 RepID=UPI0006D17E56|nr:GIY-YIG nuclease family protein [Syntrophomonas palmitatica]
MTVFGKSIKLFLLDGTPNGRWICEMSNWTGKAYKIPRTAVKECVDRKELCSSGIYFLFGTDDDTGLPLVYVGESELIFERLKAHLDGKDFWTEVIVFISKDDNLNKAHIKYLENRFHDIATQAGRYTVKNSNIPTKSSLSEADTAEMEEFIHNARIVINTLGHKVFEPIAQVAEGLTQHENLFSIQNSKGVLAKGQVVPDGFVVLKGSTISPNVSHNSVSPGVIRAREKYISNGKVVDWALQEDILFSSSSAAADFVLGNSVSGPKTWKNKDGKTLKEVEEG